MSVWSDACGHRDGSSPRSADPRGKSASQEGSKGPGEAFVVGDSSRNGDRVASTAFGLGRCSLSQSHPAGHRCILDAPADRSGVIERISGLSIFKRCALFRRSIYRSMLYPTFIQPFFRPPSSSNTDFKVNLRRYHNTASAQAAKQPSTACIN